MANLTCLFARGVQSGLRFVSQSLHARTFTLHGAPASCRKAQPYTACEVRLQLQAAFDSVDEHRRQAVFTAAGDVGGWLRLLPENASREKNLGLAAARLPSVVFWFQHGASAEDIGRRLTPFGEACYGNRAIDAACGLIADRLNGVGLSKEDSPLQWG
jgi:hypothetical protein